MIVNMEMMTSRVAIAHLQEKMSKKKGKWRGEGEQKGKGSRNTKEIQTCAVHGVKHGQRVVGLADVNGCSIRFIHPLLCLAFLKEEDYNESLHELKERKKKKRWGISQEVWGEQEQAVEQAEEREETRTQRYSLITH